MRWEDEEDSIYPQVRASIVSELVAHLEQRIAMLQEDGDVEPILAEIRWQMAECAVGGTCLPWKIGCFSSSTPRNTQRGSCSTAMGVALLSSSRHRG